MSDYTCRSCSHVGPYTDSGWLHVTDPIDGSYAYLCSGCAIREWPCPIRFVFHFGVPEWARSRLATVETLKNLNSWFGEHSTAPVEDFVVHFFHRREAETLSWLHKWDPQRSRKPVEPYSYRGWCDYRRIVVLVDETETPDSIAWITYHELAHLACSRSRMIDQAMDQENKNEGRTGYEWKDDAGHEADSEERLVNRVATAWMGGKEYARPWWRPRVAALLSGATQLPDPHAPPPVVPKKKGKR